MAVSILPGSYKGRDVIVQDVYEAVGAYQAGQMSEDELHQLECVACPSATQWRVSPRQSAWLSPALPERPRPTSRDAFAAASGEAVMNLLARDPRPRDIVTRKALENAATVVAASGGSTNAALHLPAIAHEAGIDFDLHAVAEIFKRTPYIADLKPAGRYVARDLFEIGGVSVLLKALLDGGYLHGDCITVTGKMIAENLAGVVFPSNQDIVRPTSNPLSPTGGVVGLRGTLAPEGAIVKVAGLKSLRFRGPARCFDSDTDRRPPPALPAASSAAVLRLRASFFEREFSSAIISVHILRRHPSLLLE